MLSLSNLQARRLWLHRQGMLLSAQRGHCLDSFASTLSVLGMVQLDAIPVIARAQHHIFWSRHSAYRDTDYNHLLRTHRAAFEHFSHDAALLPIDLYPYWRRQQHRRSQGYMNSAFCKQLATSKKHRTLIKELLHYIKQQGPMCSRDFAKTYTETADRSVHAWARPPHKQALDYLWLAGELEVSHRKGFTKYYDLSERIIPATLKRKHVTDAQQIHYLCHSALQRLGFATDSEVRRFYEACDLQEVKTWLANQRSSVLNIEVELHDGSRQKRYACKAIDTWLEQLPKPCQQIKIVNPFDPIVRDRDRLKKLFGFDFRIEIYTPADKRRYGYYVCPLLEGDSFIGRIDVRADRDKDCLVTRAWWLEPGIKNGKQRQQRLLIELRKLARLAGVTRVAALPKVSHVQATEA